MSIEIKNLVKSFDGKKIFDGFSYTFPDHGLFSLVGRSGVGKTTLLRLISGLDKDYSGSITSSDARFSFVFQEYRLFPQLTALDNVLFANFDNNTEAERSVCRSMLLDLGFTDEELTLKPDELSGGMKQRVSLARAFVNSASTLLLDEPTKELDEKNAGLIRDIILSQSKNRLVIIVSHDQDEIDYLGAHRIELN